MSDEHPLEDLAIAACDYSHVKVPLIGHDGNIFAIMSTVSKALRKAGATHRECEAFRRQVTDSKSYNAALAVVMDWVDVTGDCAACDSD